MLIRSTQDLVRLVNPLMRQSEPAERALQLFAPFIERSAHGSFPLEKRTKVLDDLVANAIATSMSEKVTRIATCKETLHVSPPPGFAFQQRPFLWKRLTERRMRYREDEGGLRFEQAMQIGDILRVQLEPAMQASHVPNVVCFTVDEALRTFLVSIIFGDASEILRLEDLIHVLSRAVPLYKMPSHRTWAVHFAH